MIDVRMMGHFDVTRSGSPVKIASTAAQRLVAYLALTKGMRHRRDHLAALLWPDADETAGRQNLRTALWNANRGLGPGALEADKTTVGLPAHAELQSDVERLESAGEGDADALEAALDACRGELLPGWYDEWVLRERERVAALYDRKAACSLALLEQRGSFAACIQRAERWIALGHVPEDAFRALLRAHAGLGHPAAVHEAYRRLERVLDEAYGVEPAPETRALYASLVHDRASASRAPGGPAPQAHPRMHDGPPDEPFWGREEELARLLAAARDAARGALRVVLLAGEAGQGKTSLLRAFAREAAAAEGALLVAVGTCTAYGGVAEPYLPIRDLVAQLLGDVDGAVRRGTLSRRLAERLVHAAPALRAALEGAGAARLGALVGSDAPTDRMQVFEGVASFLAAAAEHAPLALLLDDLQWADDSSLALLFHLAARLAARRVLIVGAYREEEVRAGHRLFDVVGEMERRFGDIRIDLAPRDGGRAFVDAALDREPNALGPEFRATLARWTRGNGLFTAELMRELRARGGLVRDERGVWREGTALDWSALPARIEGIVRTRLGRLSAAQRELAEIASVVGETFEAEVVAEVAGLPAREAARLLGQLATPHRIVEPLGVEATAHGRSSRFRFRHDVFRGYLYRSLSDVDRVYLHEAVAATLQALHPDTGARAPGRLAHHYMEAGLPAEAARYLLASGQAALRLGAYAEAEAQLRSALAGLDAAFVGTAEEGAVLDATLALGAALQAVRGYGAHEVRDAYLRVLDLAPPAAADARFRATWSVWAYHMQHAELERAQALADELVTLAAGSVDAYRLQAHHAQWFTALCRGRFAACLEHARAGVALEAAMPRVDQLVGYGGHDAGVCARLFAARASWFLGRPDAARGYLRAALVRAGGEEHPGTAAHAAVFAAEVHVLLGEEGAAATHAHRASALAEAHDLRHWRAFARMLLGSAKVAGPRAGLDEGIATLREGIEAYRGVGGELELPVFLGRLADALLAANRPGEAADALAEAQARSAATGESRWDAALHLTASRLSAQRSDPRHVVREHLDRALAVARAQSAVPLAQRAAAARAALPDVRPVAPGHAGTAHGEGDAAER